MLYAFDPRRTTILLIAGDKTGDDRWYETNVRPPHWLIGKERNKHG